MNVSRFARGTSALLLAGALSGCGSDNPVASGPFDSSTLAPPQNLRVSGSLLTWDPSPDAGVVGYEIEADLPDPEVAYVRVSGQPNSITAYDLQSFRTDYLNTWYRVRAVGVDGGRSVPSNAVFTSWNPESAGTPPMPDDPGVVQAGPVNP